ncbi:hypothetical protein BUALT_Bualt01G0099700 [Buddleja alternifolia]|uniref:AAA+ ATPase domain-containing protein n=1 Tax=Buddleja alternifolia TaxID=168488 RepID=A0AAV6YGD0_9LAMI|nr:hypothetical protein BUALT_Bualt01G0099700 [Buddleja alternifolia]
MFKDLRGMSGLIEEMDEQIIFPMFHPELPCLLGVKLTSGILLHGPPGCGKTMLAHAIANEAGVPFYNVAAPQLVSGVSGASEENIRELFSKARRTTPSIIFIDEFDAIASKREDSHREMERRIVAQLLTCMGESHRLVKPVDENADTETSNCALGYVLVIAATNRLDAIDPALTRPGRFDREIFVDVPDESAWIQILSVLMSNIRFEGAFDLVKIARSTAGFVGADLANLADKAGMVAIKRIARKKKVELSKERADGECKADWRKHPLLNEERKMLTISMADFEKAAKMVQPSSKREGFSTIPNVKWDDVGGLDHLRQEFECYIVRRIKFPEYYEDLGLNLETGFLLYGPPGCGKTLIAKAVANEVRANFIHIKGPQLLNKYVGESELALRTIFSRARTCSPCVLFFDEARSHRFCSPSTGKVREPSPIDATVDVMAIGKDRACENLSGADLSALMCEAAMVALDEKLTLSPSAPLTIKGEHFKRALKKISPSVSDKVRVVYFPQHSNVYLGDPYYSLFECMSFFLVAANTILQASIRKLQSYMKTGA